MNYIEARKELKNKPLPNLFLIYGTEDYLIESIVSQISERVLKTDDDQIERFDLEETPIEDCVLETETYPFFGGEKIVLADQAYFLTAQKSKSTIEHQIDALINYVENPVDFSTLILVAPFEKLDERKKIVKTLKNQAMTIHCEEVKSWHYHKWVDHLLDEHQLSIDPKAKDILVDKTGTHLAILENEIKKLALYVAEDTHVTEEIASQLVSNNGQSSGLNLVDAVMNKDLKKAIEVYKDLLHLNEEPIALIALLASQLRTIYQVKRLKTKGYSQKQMAQQLKVHSYLIKMTLERERRFDLEALYQALSILKETDLAIKQGKMDKNLAFEMLLYKLIHQLK
ncbi:DNA polymerase III, delta subunit [Pelagirhabdus alkalitolerans]|uniref:DNA polymerase III subunit delta n=1 Tax=Pelagirhabdus alkalitolerans TaxID=1612202 RepID=A0A1G6HVB8_9BACI|nr:DNA polymerase III subunit delta [Pelagirhabdus alkalitolerans]SDB97785.1 DNA polymerase III, delta subunit [Pelagirhabdus alkalitolerans]